jgi:hypothetical protein
MALILQRVFLVSGIMILVDIAFFGPGIVVPGLGVSLRRIMFVVILGALGFRRLIATRPFTNDEVAFLALILAFAVFWGMAIPLSYGYPLAYSFADVSPWLGLVIVALWPWDAWPVEGQWRKFCRFIVGAMIVLALAHIAIWALLVSDIVPKEAFELTANLASANGDDSFLRIVPLNDGQFRVFWSSSIFLLGGIYFLFVSRKTATKLWWWVALTLACLALATTYIRAFLGAIAIFFFLAALFGYVYRQRPIRLPIATVLIMWVSSILFVSVAINPAILSAIGLARDESDLDRIEQSAALLAQFTSHPIFGTGFGSYVYQVVRATETPFSYELVFYALLMKLGVAGILMLLAILVLGLRITLASQLAARRPINFATWLAFTTGLWFAGATNPMATNFVGMTIIVLLFIDMRIRASSLGDISAGPPLSA